MRDRDIREVHVPEPCTARSAPQNTAPVRSPSNSSGTPSSLPPATRPTDLVAQPLLIDHGASRRRSARCRAANLGRYAARPRLGGSPPAISRTTSLSHRACAAPAYAFRRVIPAESLMPRCTVAVAGNPRRLRRKVHHSTGRSRSRIARTPRPSRRAHATFPEVGGGSRRLRQTFLWSSHHLNGAGQWSRQTPDNSLL